MTEAPSIKEAFDEWFDGNFLDPDGGSGHLPDWFRGDMKLAWDAALATLSQPTADRREIVARAVCKAKGVTPDCLHQNYDDEPVDHTDARGRTFHYGWRNQLHIVDAAIAALDGGR